MEQLYGTITRELLQESPPNFAVGLGQGGAGDAGILMTFASPISKLTLTGLDFGNNSEDTEEMTLTAYNSSGNFIGQKHFVTQFASGAIRGTIEFSGMKYIAFNYTNTQYGFYGIDDLDFILAPPLVSIDSSDLAANSLSVTLSGLGSSTSGPLNIELVGKHNTVQTSFNNGENVGTWSHLIGLQCQKISTPKLLRPGS